MHPCTGRSTRDGSSAGARADLRACRPRSRPTGAGERARLRAHRPAGRRPDPRPLPRPQRGTAGLDRPYRLGVRDAVRPGRSGERRRPGRPGLRRPGHGRHGRPQRRRIGRTANMHRGYRFDVRQLLRAGRQPAAVRFDSAVPVRAADGGAARRRAPTSTRSRSTSSARWPATSAGTGDRTWSPPASGPIGLRSWRTGRLAQVRPLTSMDSVTVHIGLKWTPTVPGERLLVGAAVAGAREEVTAAPTPPRQSSPCCVPGAGWTSARPMAPTWCTARPTASTSSTGAAPGRPKSNVADVVVTVKPDPGAAIRIASWETGTEG